VIGNLRPTSEVWFFGQVDADAFAAWGQVLGAFGTFCAVIVAIWIAMRDGRYRDAERRDNEAAHARLISGFRDSDPPRLSVGYKNYGECPVTGVRLVNIYGRFGEVYSTGWSIEGSSEPYILAAIAPGQTIVTPPITILWPEGENVDPVAALYYPTVVFFDANGRCWERVAHDQPRRLLNPPPQVSKFPPRSAPGQEEMTRLH
jgi:hypothetical protein